MSFRHGVVHVADHLATAAFQVGSAPTGWRFSGVELFYFGRDAIMMILVKL